MSKEIRFTFLAGRSQFWRAKDQIINDGHHGRVPSTLCQSSAIAGSRRFNLLTLYCTQSQQCHCRTTATASAADAIFFRAHLSAANYLAAETNILSNTSKATHSIDITVSQCISKMEHGMFQRGCSYRNI